MFLQGVCTRLRLNFSSQLEAEKGQMTLTYIKISIAQVECELEDGIDYHRSHGKYIIFSEMEKLSINIPALKCRTQPFLQQHTSGGGC
jgi:hypothetical protein